jgi:TgpA N-terminal domain
VEPGVYRDARANVYTAPAPDLPGLSLLAVGGVGITAVLADLIAVRLRSTALAGLPLLALLGVPVMLNAGHDQVVTELVFCLGAASYLATLAVGGRAGTDAAALAMAVPVGLTSIVLALCARCSCLPCPRACCSPRAPVPGP